MASTTGFSLEPPPVIAYDGKDDDLFAPRARLLDVTDDGLQVFTRADPEKSITERLIRIWQERGDFSQLTAAKIRAGEVEVVEEEEDARPSAQDMRDLQGQMMEQLSLARQELATALDLLSVVAPLTDPPTVDLNTLPLPPQTLTIVPSVPPPAPSSDPSVNPLAHLPLATSLSSIRSSASAFFAASEKLLPPEHTPPPAEGSAPTKRAPRPPSPWPTLLHLRSTTSYSLLPIGALSGATLSGKGETRAAREVGVFFGCEEAKEAYRRGSVARISDLVGEDKESTTKGRMLVIELKMEDAVERVVWDGGEVERKGAEATLVARSRSAFAEELFSLSNEVRTDASLKAKLTLGKRSEGDSIIVDGHGWTLTLTMVSAPSHKLKPISHADSGTAAVLIPLIRLLFLQEYQHRRTPPHTQTYTRPLLQTLSAFLSHTYRLRLLISILDAQKTVLLEGELEPQLRYYGSGAARRRVLQEDAGESVLKILKGDRELGGRAVLRAGKSLVYHVSYSLLLPHQATPASLAATAGHQPLVLQAPRSAPVIISSTHHLQLLLAEQIAAVVKQAKALRAAKAAKVDANASS
ncbi:hypothetical protein BCR35DRAFT_331750 [Leucosporidium creatinivorum]|uniref:Mediator of RNA polymerase II transcription subunit 17 n=1 Tax=Leucosporidium creatinivorum TaxID=106004 RepID=A0A1Y2FB61_9BASI|nr:hypothetical protein BCR35DRAFT_331750 [Leucosporidium creatinivorum]